METLLLTPGSHVEIKNSVDKQIDSKKTNSIVDVPVALFLAAAFNAFGEKVSKEIFEVKEG